MPEEESWYEHWLLIQHFDWQGEASFPGTESIVLWGRKTAFQTGG